MDEKKRGRGRPSKLPAGERYTVRCVLVGPEMDRLRAALDRAGLSQMELSRAAVLAAVAKIERGQPVG